MLGQGDYNTTGYRIPAIECLQDGTLLITTDRRKDNDLDLPDGTIGAYIEENPKVEFDMYFLNFSVDWLTR